MKKTIILSFIILVLLTASVSPIYASKDSSPLPSWFTNAIKPFQNSINSLLQRTNNHETRIIELEKKVDFNLPNQWSVSFYEDRFTLNTPPTESPPSPPGTISLPLPPLPNPPDNTDNNCRWNNAVIDSDVSVRAIAHFNTGDIYGVGSCRRITFLSNNIPASGTTFETDIYVWWQGTEKHKKQTITVPDRPFPTWSLLLISPPLPPFTNPNSGGMLITPSEPIGIGSTNPTQ